jgi:hypothetical protein
MRIVGVSFWKSRIICIMQMGRGVYVRYMTENEARL